MLTIDACRRLVEPNQRDLSDSQVEQLRDAYMEFARIAISAWVGEQGPMRPSASPYSADEQIKVEERAAVLEFDANLPRDRALREARDQHRRR